MFKNTNLLLKNNAGGRGFTELPATGLQCVSGA
jgi:hypothetical protein